MRAEFLTRLLFATSLAASLGYLAILGDEPSSLRVLVKTIPIASLAVLVWLSLPVPQRWIFGGALGFSACGDALLAVPGDRFVLGLLAFLVSHILYIVGFGNSARRDRPLVPAAIVTMALVTAAALTMFLLLWPALESSLRVPVTVYIAALTSMALLAIWSRLGPLVALGAVLFVVSDSLLAIGRFLEGFAGLGVLVWVTYYCGQSGIAMGLIRVLTEKGARRG